MPDAPAGDALRTARDYVLAYCPPGPGYERFARYVADFEALARAEGAAEEREACAKFAERVKTFTYDQQCLADHIAIGIRAALAVAAPQIRQQAFREKRHCLVCTPAEVFPVGELLRSEMAARGLSSLALARLMPGAEAVNSCTLDMILHLDAPGAWLGVETARALETALGIDADFLLRIDAAWQLRAFMDGARSPSSGTEAP